MSLPVAKLEHCAFGCFGYPCFSQLFKRAGIAANAAAGDGKNDLQCDYGGVLSSNSYYTLQTLEMLFVLKGCIGFVSKLLIVLERLRQNANVGNHWTVFQPAIPRVKVLFLPTFVVSTSWAACPGNPVQSALGHGQLQPVGRHLTIFCLHCSTGKPTKGFGRLKTHTR